MLYILRTHEPGSFLIDRNHNPPCCMLQYEDIEVWRFPDGISWWNPYSNRQMGNDAFIGVLPEKKYKKALGEAFNEAFTKVTHNRHVLGQN